MPSSYIGNCGKRKGRLSLSVGYFQLFLQSTAELDSIIVIDKIKRPKMSLNPNHGINSRDFFELILFQFRFSGENSASQRIDNFEFLTIKVYPDSLNMWDGVTNLCWWYLQEVVILHSISILNISFQNWINVCNWHNVPKGCYFLFHLIRDQFSLWGIPVSII